MNGLKIMGSILLMGLGLSNVVLGGIIFVMAFFNSGCYSS